jgi:osmotically inducible protein OsmC
VHVHGFDEAEFQKLAQEAKEGCPVSKLFKGNTEITLAASLTGH